MEFLKDVEKVKISSSSMQVWITDIFKTLGMSEEDSVITTNNLVSADLRGVYSHGVMRVPIYAQRLQKKVTDPAGKPEIVRDIKATALVDGNNAMGQVAGKYAMDIAAQKAKQYGIGYVAVKGSNHYGASAYFAMMVLSENMIGMTGTISGVNSMAPWGGTDGRLGNNPFSIAIPALTKDPIVLDMAHSVVARGKIVLASKTKQPIPEDWALAPDGRPTTDPVQAYHGTVQPIGGYKGYGMTLVTGLLSTMLSGAAFGKDVTDLYEDFRTPQDVGHYMQAINISAFTDPEIFKARVDQAINYMHNSPKAKGVKEILVPGELEARKERKQLKEGIEYPVSVVDELKILSRKLGVQPAMDIEEEEK